jgi:hypothetical protein
MAEHFVASCLKKTVIVLDHEADMRLMKLESFMFGLGL